MLFHRAGELGVNPGVTVPSGDPYVPGFWCGHFDEEFLGYE